MSTDKHRADQLADALEALEATGWGGDCFALTDHSEEQARLAAAELRRIPALEAEIAELVEALEWCVEDSQAAIHEHVASYGHVYRAQRLVEMTRQVEKAKLAIAKHKEARNA